MTLGVVEEEEDESDSSNVFDSRPTELSDVRVEGVQLDSYSGALRRLLLTPRIQSLEIVSSARPCNVWKTVNRSSVPSC